MATATKTFKLELITPEKVLLDIEVERLVAVTETGEIGVLAKHADMTCKLEPAPLKYWAPDGKKDILAVIGGILEVKDNKVTIITDFALNSSDIDEAKAQKAAEEAKADLQMRQQKARDNAIDKELVIAEYKLQKELIFLKTIRLKKNF